MSITYSNTVLSICKERKTAKCDKYVQILETI